MANGKGRGANERGISVALTLLGHRSGYEVGPPLCTSTNLYLYKYLYDRTSFLQYGRP